MTSLKSRLLLGTGVVVAVGLIASSTVVYSVSYSTLYREFDNALLEKARTLAALTEYDVEEACFATDFVESDFVEFSRKEQPHYFQKWLHDGRVLHRSLSLGHGDLSKLNTPPNQPRFDSVSLPDGRAGRQVTLVFYPKISEEDEDQIVADEHDIADAAEADQDDDVEEEVARHMSTMTVVVANGTAAIDGTLAELGWLLAIVSTAATLGSVFLLVIVVPRGLEPLRRISGQIERIDEQSLDTRVRSDSVPKEIVPIVERLNGLVERLEAAFTRERSFSSDVAHELRTPLAGLRSTIEVCLGQERSTAEYRESLDLCLEICSQAQEMVEALLVIARVETGRVSTETEAVSFASVLRECWEQFEREAASKRLRERWQLSEPCDIETDRGKLWVVIRNIFENAVAHSDADGEVRVTTRQENGSVRLCVENSGNCLSADQVDNVFQRFWRGDAARTNTGKHAGLGLSLAQRLTELLGGGIRVELDGQLFRVLLYMPMKFPQ